MIRLCTRIDIRPRPWRPSPTFLPPKPNAARRAPGAGTCIFVHLRQSADSSTAGCMTMVESAMKALLAWLRPQDRPIFVLLPLTEYAPEIWVGPPELTAR